MLKYELFFALEYNMR